jgi:hypothetical protein
MIEDAIMTILALIGIGVCLGIGFRLGFRGFT